MSTRGAFVFYGGTMSRRAPYYAARADANQSEIVKGLEKLGYSVKETHRVGKDFPDLVIAKLMKTAVTEIKTKEAYDSKNHGLSKGQMEFRETWQGYYIVGWCVEQIDYEFVGLPARLHFGDD